jgi:hypothetical protein
MSLIDLIRDYTLRTEAAVAQLRSELGVDDLLDGWHRNEFPQRGRLRDGSEYQFHGIGCSVEQGEVDLDFDFGADGRTGGFDAWRLWRFATQFPDRYPNFQQRHVVELAIQSMVSEGAVCTSEFGSLLYLRKF